MVWNRTIALILDALYRYQDTPEYTSEDIRAYHEILDIQEINRGLLALIYCGYIDVMDKMRFKLNNSGRKYAEEYPIASIHDFIVYLENIPKDRWCIDVCVREASGCLRLHLLQYGGNKFLELFESTIATEYMYFPVNDGKHPEYTQDNPKDRVISYIKDIISGTKKNVCELMDEEYNLYLKNTNANKHVKSNK